MEDDEVLNDDEVEAYKDDVVDEASYLEDGVGQNDEEVEVAYEDDEAQKVDQKNVSQMEAQGLHEGKVGVDQKEKNALGMDHEDNQKGTFHDQNLIFFFYAFFLYLIIRILAP